ncbi:septal ring lytic transglycosylase RlpA family protein [Bosea sp. 117]|uniref:septal ring lytic transglycosylase RlpA family protein n=1 Tax=Bosea sp. 117 TaxID=1125973 RepID=UPI0020C10A1C|nr:septal ring lytic transglycosylase RlpA family protein [Bosea sp. 117]
MPHLGRLLLVVGVGLTVANCNTSSKLSSKIDPKYGVSASPRVVAFGQPVPKGGGTYRVGKPYQVAGRTYVPQENARYKAEGLASWYGDDFHGRLTANGEVFDMASIAAAHPTLPMPSYVRITNLQNRRSLIVRVNDRGPYHSDRLIDVSAKAADLLGFKNRGTARVRVEYVGRAPLDGSDDRKLMATLRENGSAPAPSDGGAVMVASNGSAPPVGRLPVASDAPTPPSRPFDLGQESEVAVAPAAVSRTTSIPMPATHVATTSAAPAQKPAAPQPAAPKPVAVAAAPQPVAPPAPAAAPAPRPVQVASTAPQKPAATSGSLSSTGWVVGAQPVANYAPAGMVTPVSTGRGLY